MKKIVYLVISLLLLCNISILAQDHYVVDEIGYLSNMQISELEDRAIEVSDALGFEVRVYLINDSIDGFDKRYDNTNDNITLVANEEEYTIYSSMKLDTKFIDAMSDAYYYGGDVFSSVEAFLQKAYDLYAGKESTPHVKGNKSVIDHADLLSEKEEEKLSEKIDALREKYDYDIVVLTVYSLDGKTSQAYADDFYDYNGYKDDGILLLVSMEYRDYALSTKGKGIKTFTDKGLEYISDAFLPYLSDGDYYKAFNEFANQVDDFVRQSMEGKSYDVNNMPKEKFNLPFSLGISALIGLIVSLVTCFILKGQLKSVKNKYQADDYLKDNSFHLKTRNDIYLYRHVSQTRKPEQNSTSHSGGGSSVHVSSSGSSHGGRSGKF